MCWNLMKERWLLRNCYITLVTWKGHVLGLTIPAVWSKLVKYSLPTLSSVWEFQLLLVFQDFYKFGSMALSCVQWKHWFIRYSIAKLFVYTLLKLFHIMTAFPKLLLCWRFECSCYLTWQFEVLKKIYIYTELFNRLFWH